MAIDVALAPTILTKIGNPAFAGTAAHDVIERTRRDDSTDHLADHIGDEFREVHPPGDQHAEADGRVDMAAGDGSDAIGHGDQAEAEGEGNSREADMLAGNDGGAATDENERKRADHLGKRFIE